jgi:hypothetical protein
VPETRTTDCAATRSRTAYAHDPFLEYVEASRPSLNTKLAPFTFSEFQPLAASIVSSSNNRSGAADDTGDADGVAELDGAAVGADDSVAAGVAVGTDVGEGVGEGEGEGVGVAVAGTDIEIDALGVVEPHPTTTRASISEAGADLNSFPFRATDRSERATSIGGSLLRLPVQSVRRAGRSRCYMRRGDQFGPAINQS